MPSFSSCDQSFSGSYAAPPGQVQAAERAQRERAGAVRGLGRPGWLRAPPRCSPVKGAQCRSSTFCPFHWPGNKGGICRWFFANDRKIPAVRGRRRSPISPGAGIGRADTSTASPAPFCTVSLFRVFFRRGAAPPRSVPRRGPAPGRPARRGRGRGARLLNIQQRPWLLAAAPEVGGRAADSNMAAAAAAGRRGGGLGRPPAPAAVPVGDVPPAGELVRPSVTELSQVRTNILCTVPGCGKVLPNSPALNMHLSKAHPLQVPPPPRLGPAAPCGAVR